MLQEGVQALLDAVFPPRCVSCRAVGSPFCATCIAHVRPPAPPVCTHCGLALHFDAAKNGNTTRLCADCLRGAGPQALDALRAAAIYEGTIRLAILALKFEGQRRLARPLGDLLAAVLLRLQQRDPAYAAPGVVVPIPLHRARRRERGYNQAELLARRCARHVGLPYLPHALVRTRATTPQMTLRAGERRANIAGAFALASVDVGRRLAGTHIILIDDAATTGSTLAAAATVLRTCSPASVVGLTLARPEPERSHTQS